MDFLIHGFDKLVCLKSADSFLFFGDNHFPEEVGELFWDLLGFGEFYWDFYDLFEVLNAIGFAPREHAIKHFVGENAETPNIAFYRVLGSFNNLNSHIIWRADNCLLYFCIFFLGLLH